MNVELSEGRGTCNSSCGSGDPHADAICSKLVSTGGAIATIATCDTPGRDAGDVCVTQLQVGHSGGHCRPATSSAQESSHADNVA